MAKDSYMLPKVHYDFALGRTHPSFKTIGASIVLALARLEDDTTSKN